MERRKSNSTGRTCELLNSKGTEIRQWILDSRAGDWASAGNRQGAAAGGPGLLAPRPPTWPARLVLLGPGPRGVPQWLTGSSEPGDLALQSVCDRGCALASSLSGTCRMLWWPSWQLSPCSAENRNFCLAGGLGQVSTLLCLPGKEVRGLEAPAEFWTELSPCYCPPVGHQGASPVCQGVESHKCSPFPSPSPSHEIGISIFPLESRSWEQEQRGERPQPREEAGLEKSPGYLGGGGGWAGACGREGGEEKVGTCRGGSVGLSGSWEGEMEPHEDKHRGLQSGRARGPTPCPLDFASVPLARLHPHLRGVTLVASPRPHSPHSHPPTPF